MNSTITLQNTTPKQPEQTETASAQIVPKSSSVRKQIQNAVKKIVMAEELVPPQTAHSLERHARGCLQGLELSESFVSYTMTILNNDTWEEYFTHIPRDQRLLLLPICLRSHKHCNATCDELGLLCEECGKCLIPQITQKAEEAGMNVLVTESMSTVTQWVESGEIQGIIGVSCLNSLQEAFSSMIKQAVPGIAVPLIGDGCQDTTFDLSMLEKALNLEEAPEVYNVPGAHIREYLNELFTEEGVARYLNASTPYLKTFTQLTYGALCDDGKHYRPLITFGIWCALLNRNHLPDYLNPIALAVECFHKASLIHDDIEDNDDLRYEKPTLHKKAGIPVALNIGDFLIGEGYRLLGHDSIPAEMKPQLYAQAAEGHCRLALGQAQEFESLSRKISLEECLETHRLKTAPAFRVALSMGAIAAGKFEEYKDIFDSFANALGVAYQLSDDLEDELTNPASAVDCLMVSNSIDRETARAEILEVYREFRMKSYLVLEEIKDSILKTFIYRLCGKVLKDV